MKLVAGLGNPGRKYQGTRHNVGFEVIARLHAAAGSPRPTAKFDSELVAIELGGVKVLLQSPLTYMNASGRAVRAAMDFYKIPQDDLLVVCDDFNLDLGRLRFRPSGSAGGQNGLKDIIQKLGNPDFSRLRIGVGKPPPEWNVSNYVLSRFRDDEQPELQKTLDRAAESVRVWVRSGTQEAMNRFNADPNRPKSPKKRGADSATDGSGAAEQRGQPTPDPKGTADSPGSPNQSGKE